MKSPDEIKKGLERCSSIANCADGCPYHVTVEGSFGCEEMGCEDGLLPDALALIHQLEAQVPSWISVEERLPGERLCVSVYIQEDGGAYWIETAFRRDGKWRIQGEYVIDRNITHWMHLPQPPKD